MALSIKLNGLIDRRAVEYHDRHDIMSPSVVGLHHPGHWQWRLPVDTGTGGVAAALVFVLACSMER
jgi:hypothetical protein